MATRNEERMKYALEDIEKYAQQLSEAGKTLDSLTQTLLDIPDADDAIKISEGYAEIYHKLSEELLRHTSRGLNK